jgi:hypothetical protein
MDSQGHRFDANNLDLAAAGSFRFSEQIHEYRMKLLDFQLL